MSFDDLKYVQNPNAPTMRAHGLQEFHFISPSDGLFELFTVKSEGGVWVKETALWVEMPIVSIPPGIALTTRKLAQGIIEPIVSAMSRLPLMH